ncbi:ABC transporter substrate-binding protein [Tropicimonas sp. IMCC34011]|uniref:ABC transporter substrate-binding protein n=1 Tax=Tropicimonas sp. IMCC34011 TaxID=2248759 RepID=UPI000E233694|nr:ABC transporter substrate-binding protein [Tropicimonas sp. IMCC34011]
MTEFRLTRRQALQRAGGGGVALALGSLAGTGAVFAQENTTLRIRNDRDIERLDPATRGGWYDETVMFAIFSGLVRYAPGDDWTWELDAASSIDDSDPLHIGFELRPGLLFSDDHGEMTAEDVKFSYERFADPEVNAVYASDWAALDHVEVTGTYTGIIHLKEAFAPLFTSTLPHASGLILSKAAMEASGTKSFATEVPACSGPYMLDEWRPREVIRLVRNPGWTGPEPYYDRIEILPIGDVTSAETAFAAGDIDCTQIAVNSIPSYEGGRSDLVVKPALGYAWLGMNVENPKLSDLTVRRAIQHAVNVKQIVDATFGGAVDQAHGLVPPPLPGARDEVLYGYDPERARELLAEAGVQGLSLSLTFGTSPDLLIVAQVLQVQLAAVGIDLTIRQMDSNTMVAEAQHPTDHQNIELIIEPFTTAPDPSWVTEWFTCDQIGDWNFQRTCSEEWDARNDEALTISDPEARAARYVALQDELEETGAYVFLYHGVNAWVSKPSVNAAYSADAQWALLRDFTAG